MPRRLLSLAFRALCLSLAFALLARMLGSQDLDSLRRARETGRLLPCLAALFLYLAVQFLGAWRWGLLLKAQGFPLPFWQALRLTLGGNFFSLVIPGGVSGDLVKVGAATAAHPGKAPELALADLLDRAIGLTGLFWAGLLSLCLPWGDTGARLREASPALLKAGLGVFLLGAAGSLLFFLGWLLWPARLQDGNSPPPGKAPRLPFLRRPLKRLGAALAPYRGNPLVLGKALALSILIHLLLGIEFLLLGRALGESFLDAPAYLLSTQLANATALLPITPGGVGVRDTVAQSLLLAFGATPPESATLIPLLHTLILTFWGLKGGFLYALTPAPSRPPTTGPHP